MSSSFLLGLAGLVILIVVGSLVALYVSRHVGGPPKNTTEARPSKKELLIGKWEHKKTEGEGQMKMTVKITMEFKRGGKAKFSADLDGRRVVDADGTYKWAEGDHIEVTMNGEKTEKMKVLEVDDKELKLESKMMGGRNEIMKFTKVK
jgi:uncharacterized protein (TIGR03066 family)